MILIIDLTSNSWSSFASTNLQSLASGTKLTRLPKREVDRIGLIVRHLGSRSLISADEVIVSSLSQEETRELKRLKHLYAKVPIWLISDSGFFNSLPASAFSLMVAGDNIRRIGRQGLVHADLAEQAAQALGKNSLELNMITLFLDETSSAAAIKEGIAIEASSGLSDLEGLPGAWNSGDIDGEFILQLVSRHGVVGTRKILTQQSGLLGRSDLKGSLKDILSKPKLRTNAKFHLSLRIYLHRLTKLLGGYQALLGRTDVVVFSGILGTKSAFVREELTASLGLLRYSNILTLEAKPHLLAARMIRSL